MNRFDIIVGNFPYNDSNSRNAGKTIWNKFILKIFKINILQENGYLILVHPTGWRNIDGRYRVIYNIYKEMQILYLNMNTSKDGQKTFGAITSYDFYCIKNNKIDKIKTKIIDIDNIVYYYNLNNAKFIPNKDFDIIFDLIAKDNEDKVQVLHSHSDYEHRKEYMSDEKNDIYKYPCVYSIKKGNIPTFKYSSRNDKGHFNIPKIILGNGANPTYLIDKKGEFGMTSFAFGIIDNVENFDFIEKILQSEEIKDITSATKFVSTNGNPIIYPKILSILKKDFWKKFINRL